MSPIRSIFGRTGKGIRPDERPLANLSHCFISNCAASASTGDIVSPIQTGHEAGAECDSSPGYVEPMSFRQARDRAVQHTG
jgi:hypothetical protein